MTLPEIIGSICAVITLPLVFGDALIKPFQFIAKIFKIE
jgi:hypothetical protein